MTEIIPAIPSAICLISALFWRHQKGDLKAWWVGGGGGLRRGGNCTLWFYGACMKAQFACRLLRHNVHIALPTERLITRRRRRCIVSPRQVVEEQHAASRSSRRSRVDQYQPSGQWTRGGAAARRRGGGCEKKASSGALGSPLMDVLTSYNRADMLMEPLVHTCTALCVHATRSLKHDAECA